MGLRFRRSIKLAPGIRMNFSGSGVSWTVGPRGASLNFGQRGTYLNTGIPGTGIYARQRIDSPRAVPHRSATQVELQARVTVQDDGQVVFRDMQDNLLPDNLVDKLKQQQGAAIHGLIEDCCNKINAPVLALGGIHLHTPDPRQKQTYVPQTFAEPEPYPPNLKPRGFLGALFRSRAPRIPAENQQAQGKYD